MTTNALDLANRLLASDSRWSFRTEAMKNRGLAVVAYVDDTNYDKIAIDDRRGYAYMFAGPHHLIDRWKDWVKSPSNEHEGEPPVEDEFAICVIDADSGELLFEHGQRVNGATYRFAGTGAGHAYNCWTTNQDVKLSVMTAMTRDPLSGGKVVFFDCPTNENNLYGGVKSTSIETQFLERGMVMYYNTQEARTVPVSLERAIKDDGSISDLVSAVKAGKVSAEAPSGLDPVIWTEKDRARLKEALTTMRAKKPKY